MAYRCIIPFLPDDATCEVEAYEVGGPKELLRFLLAYQLMGVVRKGLLVTSLGTQNHETLRFTPQIMDYNP